MLFGEEFAKKATDRVEAIKAIKKISCQKPGKKHPGCFSGTTSRNNQTTVGVSTKAATGDFSPTSRPQLK